MKKVPYKIIKVKARDWAMTHGQNRTDGKWEPVTGWICGWLIDETDTSIAISQQLFHEDGDDEHWNCRGTITIPKETILERKTI